MKVFNIVLVLLIGLLGYGVTYYLDGRSAPKIHVIEGPLLSQEQVDFERAPDFSFTDIHGNSYALSDFKDKVVILNFWASWCAPCVKEFPDLLGLVEGREDDVVMIALSSDFKAQTMMRFVGKMKKTNEIKSNVFIALDESGAVTNKIFGTYKLPETLLINQHQQIVYKFIGASWDLEFFDSKIKKLLMVKE